MTSSIFHSYSNLYTTSTNMTTMSPVTSLAYFRARAYEIKVHRECLMPSTIKLKARRRVIYSEIAPARRTVIQDRSNVS